MGKKLGRIGYLILSLILIGGYGFCATTPTAPVASVSRPQTAPVVSPVAPQAISYEQCNKMFGVNSEKLFYLALSSANANRFTIDEIQSKSGYIVFKAGGRDYLATVLAVDGKNSILKITPVNNSYYFPIGVVSNFFKYIELNINAPIEKIW